MPVFAYKVKNSDGELITGVLEFNNEEEVIKELRNKNYFIIDITQPSALDKNLSLKTGFSLFNRVTARDLTIFTRQFSILINSGMSLIEALGVLIDQTVNKKFKSILIDVRNNIESGLSLSEALQKHKNIFSKLFVSMINAGEMGGVLDKTLNDLAIFLEKENDIQIKIRNKTAYPKFVMSFAFVVVLVLIIFIIPIFQSSYESLGAQLPLLTRIVINLGKALKTIWFYIGAIIVFFGGRYLIRKAAGTPKGKYFFDNIKMHLPKFGDLIRKIALSRFARTLGILLSAGVPILRSLEIVKGVSNNIIIDNAVNEIKDSIRSGENIAIPLSRYNIFPPMFIQMVNVGEKSGTLDVMLNKVADFYDNEIASSIDILMTVLEPLMLLVVAAIIAIVVVAMYLPMFRIYQYIS
ncbi:MAG: type II secretion system F family protein [Actinobacteria bacterium]|nr:type II secretion system F family protein [Actinomycetota bacterium]